MNFKKGDKIRLNLSLDTESSHSMWAKEQLVDGEIYEVVDDQFRSDNTDWVRINNKKGTTNSYNPKQFELVKDFPKKWSVKGGTELVSFLSECRDKKILSTYYNGDSVHRYYNFDGKTIERTDEPEFQIVTVEELNDHYLSKKIQVGWRVKPEFIEAASRITGNYHFKVLGAYFPKLGYDFQTNSNTEKVLSNANVLELFCDGVYEEQRKPVKITGDYGYILIDKDISVNGDRIVDAKHLEDLIFNLQTTQSNFLSKYSNGFTGWDVKYEASVKIGCTSFTIQELTNILTQWKNWNK